jgi:hypothetical protein
VRESPAPVPDRRSLGISRRHCGSPCSAKRRLAAARSEIALISAALYALSRANDDRNRDPLAVTELSGPLRPRS